MNPSYIRFGGVARDLPAEFFEQCSAFLACSRARSTSTRRS